MAQQATTATANGPIYGGANNGALTNAGTVDERRALYLKLFSGAMFKGFHQDESIITSGFTQQPLSWQG